MTVPSVEARNEYTATAGQTEFSYTFKIYDDEELNVYRTPVGQDPSDADDILVLSVNYDVDGVLSDAGSRCADTDVRRQHVVHLSLCHDLRHRFRRDHTT